jgi:carbamoyl-phosphate synthase large subunit
VSARVTALFLNAGRRVEMLDCFRKAFAAEGVSGRIIATDIQPLAPAWYLADDRFLLPSSRDAEFIESLGALCRAQSVDLVIPFIDPDLSVLAANRELLAAAGAKVLVSAKETIRLCRDKQLTADFLLRRDLPGIRTLSPADAHDAPFPLFIKPRGGSAGVGAHKVEDREQLAFLLKRIPDPLIQPFVAGAEYTVDVFCAPDSGRTLAAVPRRRLKVRGGEVSVGRIERNEALEQLAADVVEALGLRGPGCVQIIAGSDGAHVIEVNPRFCGGCPLSVAAGAPFIGWCLDLMHNVPLRQGPFPITDELTMLRYDMSVFLPRAAPS